MTTHGGLNDAVQRSSLATSLVSSAVVTAPGVFVVDDDGKLWCERGSVSCHSRSVGATSDLSSPFRDDQVVIFFRNRPTPVVIAFPDVCKTPSPGGPIPIPYPNFGFGRF
jgi:hypothetical protein